MPPLSAIPARVRALPARTQDLLLAAVVTVLGIVDVGIAVRDAEPATWLLGAAVLAVIGIAFTVRRERPLAACVLGFAMLAVAEQNEALYHTNAPFLALLVFPYSLARHTDGREFKVGLATLVVIVSVAIALTPGGATVEDWLFAAALIVGAPVTVGRLLRSRDELRRTLEAKQERLGRERRDAGERAVADERERIAGELHDVVSHALSAMTVGAGGARLLARRDPARAAEAFGLVEDTGREALMELRRLLGVLRHEDEELALAPQPSLATLGDLARRVTRAGLPVVLEVEGEPPAAVSAGVDLAAYRVVQAALTAARDEGRATRATVRVRYSDGDVAIEVTDDGGGTRALLGMRERVSLYGGDLQAAPLLRGGHAVRARMPLEAVAA